MNTGEILSILKETEAFLDGHFVLSSGLHSPNYVQCALVLQHTELAERFGRLMAELYKGKGIEVVISPALGGIVIGHEVARALGVKAIFAERVSAGIGSVKMTLRRGFGIKSGEKVLVVEDVITTGGSTKEIIEVVNDNGESIVGIACLIDRSRGKADFGVPAKSLVTFDIETYDPESCPLCEKGIPVVKPGSRRN